MAKNFKKTALLIVLLAIFLLTLVGCDFIGDIIGGDLGGGGETGLYLRQVLSSIDENDYVILNKKDSSWQSPTESGTYTLSDGTLTLQKDGATIATATFSGSGDKQNFSFTRDGISYTYVYRDRNPEPVNGPLLNGRLNFNAGEGVNLSTKTIETTLGRTYKLPYPVRSGYVFGGWKEEATGLVFTNDTPAPSRTVELTAIWQPLSQTDGVYSDSVVTINYANCGKTVTDVTEQKTELQEEFANHPSNLYHRRYYFSACFFLELDSRDLGGVAEVGKDGNFRLMQLEGLDITRNPGCNVNIETSETLSYGRNFIVISIVPQSGTSYFSYLFLINVKQDFTVRIYDGAVDVGSQYYHEIFAVEGEPLPQEAVKQIDGLEFKGFKVCRTNEDFALTAPVTGDVNLYQTYQPKEITLNADGGMGISETVLLEPYAERTYLSSIVPERTGYDFLGWRDDDGTYQFSLRGQQLKAIFQNNIYDKLNAVWQKQKFLYNTVQQQLDDKITVSQIGCSATYEDNQLELSYYCNGNKINLADYDVLEYGQELVLTSGCTTYNFSFLGWFDSTGTNRLDSDGASYADLRISVTQSKTYLARWCYYTVTLSQNNQGGQVALTGGKEVSRGDYVPTFEGSAVEEGATATATATSYLGYEFDGWYNGETKVSDQSQYQFQMSGANLLLEARYKVQDALAGFRFTSTATTCLLTGIVDKTVTSLVVPATFTGIANGALAGMTNLQNLTISVLGENAQNQGNLGVLFGASSVSGNATSIPQTLVKVTFSGEALPASAFKNCANITEIVLTQDLVQIPDNAFEGCSALATIAIPQTVVGIGNHAFDGCATLSSLALPSGLQEIGVSAFSGTTSLLSLTIPSGYTQVGNFAFAGMSVTSLVLAAQTTKIGNNAFAGCAQLATLTIPNSVTQIGANAFDGCESLSTVALPSGITVLTAGLFGGFTGLTQFSVADGVTAIGDGAFKGCTNLESVTISKTVRTIGAEAFALCKKLATVTFQKDSMSRTPLTSVGNNAFEETAIEIFVFPESENTVTIGKDMFKKSSLREISFCRQISTITASAFEGLTTLQKVTFNGVIVVEQNAFHGCTSLNSVTFQNNSALTTLGDSAFSGCISLSLFSLGSVLQEIGRNCFENTLITNFTIPRSVQVIMPYALGRPTKLIFETMSGSQYCHTYKLYDAKTGNPISTNNTWRPYSINQYPEGNSSGIVYHTENAQNYYNRYGSYKLVCID